MLRGKFVTILSSLASSKKGRRTMPEHDEMGAQRTATSRNARAEFVAGYILTRLVARMSATLGTAKVAELRYQVPFQSDIASDVWDHCIRVTRCDGDEVLYSIWAQTTCYKGNSVRRTESNKTYEIRETLIEGLSLISSGRSRQFIRTIHFTFGPRDYGYAWFTAAKKATFDISIWLSLEAEDIHEAIEGCLEGAILEKDKVARLEDEIKRDTALGIELRRTIDALGEWWGSGEPGENRLASAQASCLSSSRPRLTEVAQALEGAATKSIKEGVVDALCSGDFEQCDRATAKIVGQIEIAKPFFRSCRKNIEDWDEFVSEVAAVGGSSDSLYECALKLWGIPSPLRESVRRILPRLVDAGGVEYIQDVDVPGVTEHGFYSSDYSSEQQNLIVRSFIDQLSLTSQSPQGLLAALESRGRNILRTRLYFEARNGTSIRPSMLWASEFLTENGYQVNERPSRDGVDLRGYHSSFPNAGTVRPYTNFLSVRNNKNKQICLLKAKYFSAAEFDRRCKEEAYVGLTLRYKLMGDTLLESGRPSLIMLVDKDHDAHPSAASISKLACSGWNVVFSGDQLLAKLAYLDR